MTSSWLAPRRILLNLLTVLVVVVAGLSLLNSLFQSPPQTQLDLIQTHLALQASRTLDNPEYQPLATPLLGSDLVGIAAQRYAKTTDQLNARIQRFQATLPKSQKDDPLSTQPPPGLYQLQVELDALRLRTGILAAYRQELEQALGYWQSVSTLDLDPTAQALAGLWGNPQRIVPDAEVALRSGLDGWFRGIALQRLYTLQQRTDALNTLNQDQEQRAIAALTRLLLVGGIPILGIALGIVILLGWVGWHLWHKRPLLGSGWRVPWSGVDVQGVLTGWFVGFFGLGWLVPQLYVGMLGIPAGQLNPLQRSVELLLTYLSSAGVGLGLIIRVARADPPPSQGSPATSEAPTLADESQLESLPSTRSTWPEIPSAEIPSAETLLQRQDLFRFRVWDPWPLWGTAAYLAAMPMVLVAGALSQVLLPEGGGGNPLLPLLLQSQGWQTRLIFFGVVSVCAPVFEEILFRGFVLPSLSQWIPMWGAVGISAVLFAAAHLSLADLLPLTALGLVLGIVYSRSRNLLAPMLIHSLWNTGSLVALVALGQAI